MQADNLPSTNQLTHAMRRATKRRSVKTFILLCRLGMIATSAVLLWTIIEDAYVLFGGDAAVIKESLGPDIVGPFDGWRVALSLAALTLYLLPIFVAFWFTHRFFREFELGNNFGLGPERLLRHVGWAMILFWLAAWIAESTVILMLTDRSGMEILKLLVPPLNEYFLTVVLGLILLCIASILAEARRIHEENQQIV